MKNRNKANYLDYIPVCAPEYSWRHDQQNRVIVEVENKGFYNCIAQKIFKRPRISHISLDEYGSFVWQQMDGQRTIYEIAGLVRQTFGPAAEPVAERLSQYFQVLYRNHFIGYVTDKQ